MRFADRMEAGERLAPLVARLQLSNPIVLGLPRGGVPVAAVVADMLGAPLDVLVVRKLGAPHDPEYAIGAVGEQGVRIVDEAAIRMLGIGADRMALLECTQREELARRAVLFRRGRPPLDLAGRTVVLVDDGVATGATAAAACRVARALGASRVVLAVPVAPPEWTQDLRAEADELVAVETPTPFRAVGLWYARFEQTSHDEVIAALALRH